VIIYPKIKKAIGSEERREINGLHAMYRLNPTFMRFDSNR